MPVNRLIQNRRGTESQWSSVNPVLSSGEIGFNLTNSKIKVGDGYTPWNNLPYSDQDKVDKNSLVLNVKDFGAIGDGVADDTTAVNAAVLVAKNATNKGGTIYFPAGTYNITSTINLQQERGRYVIVRGASRTATTIQTANDIVVFQHAENTTFSDFNIKQFGTAKTGRAFSTGTNVQAGYCVYERLSVNGFKYGAWWRYSLWCTVRNVTFKDNACGMKLSRNASPDDQTNPVAPGNWNIDPGFFHNQNTFDNVIFEGGEVGFWGTVNGNVFSNVTTQGQGGSTGSDNVVLPIGEQGIGLFLQGSGLGTGGASTFGATSNNIIQLYAEYTRQPIVMENSRASLGAFYVQGGSSSNKFPQAIKITGGSIDSRGATVSGTDWFDYRMVAQDTTILGDPTAGTTAFEPDLVNGFSLTNTKWYRNGVGVGDNFNMTVTGTQTIDVMRLRNRSLYTVKIMEIYDGSSIRTASFDVYFWVNGTARVVGHPDNSTQITCNINANRLEIGVSGSLAHNIIMNVTNSRQFGEFPYYS